MIINRFIEGDVYIIKSYTHMECHSRRSKKIKYFIVIFYIEVKGRLAIVEFIDYADGRPAQPYRIRSDWRDSLFLEEYLSRNWVVRTFDPIVKQSIDMEKLEYYMHQLEIQEPIDII